MAAPAHLHVRPTGVRQHTCRRADEQTNTRISQLDTRISQLDTRISQLDTRISHRPPLVRSHSVERRVGSAQACDPSKESPFFILRRTAANKKARGAEQHVTNVTPQRSRCLDYVNSAARAEGPHGGVAHRTCRCADGIESRAAQRWLNWFGNAVIVIGRQGWRVRQARVVQARDVRAKGARVQQRVDGGQVGFVGLPARAMRCVTPPWGPRHVRRA